MIRIMGIISTLYDGLKDNDRIKDLGFAVLGGTISILGTRLLTGVKESKEFENDEEYDDD